MANIPRKFLLSKPYNQISRKESKIRALTGGSEISSSGQICIGSRGNCTNAVVQLNRYFCPQTHKPLVCPLPSPHLNTLTLLTIPLSVNYFSFSENVYVIKWKTQTDGSVVVFSLPQARTRSIRIPYTFRTYSYLVTSVLPQQNEGELHTA